MTSEEILASITHHYIVVSDHLTRSQLQEHKRRGSCPACDSGIQRPVTTASCEDRRAAGMRDGP